MHSHFIHQAAERGFADVASSLAADLRLAIKRLREGVDYDGQYIEHVMDCLGPDRAIYRFLVDDRIGYAVISARSPITCLTKEMVDALKAEKSRDKGARAEAVLSRKMRHVGRLLSGGNNSA